MAEVAKKENAWSMIKLGLVLCAYAVAACAMLAVVNNFTAPKIAQNQERKVSQAMAEFFPDAVEKTLVLTADPATNVVTFIYSSFKHATVTVHFVDMDGNAIATEDVQIKKVGNKHECIY